MSHNKKVTDAYLGFEDIKKKTIRTIGNPKVRFEEDPARILIAISLISQLGFRIHKKPIKRLKLSVNYYIMFPSQIIHYI